MAKIKVLFALLTGRNEVMKRYSRVSFLNQNQKEGKKPRKTNVKLGESELRERLWFRILIRFIFSSSSTSHFQNTEVSSHFIPINAFIFSEKGTQSNRNTGKERT